MIVIYSATSLDGYIARKDGSIDWLSEGAAASADYQRFISAIDGLLMGRHTYDQILGFGKWPYREKPAYVFTHHPPSRHFKKVNFIAGGPKKALALMNRRHLKRVWLVGGTGTALPFLQQSLVEEYTIFIMPILLGDGIPLFPDGRPEQLLELVSSETLAGGIVKLQYKKKVDAQAGKQKG